MKYLFTFIFAIIFFFSLSQNNPSLVEIPIDVFINGGETELDSIFIQNDQIKEDLRKLFSSNEAIYDRDWVQLVGFDKYWERYKDNWHYIKVKPGDTLLVFSGLRRDGDDREFVSIYDMNKEPYQRQLYNDVGRIIAYKEHPFTKEIILFSHQYPCCQSASHTIYSFRFINNQLKVEKRFFVGRDSGDMVGPFFPNKVQFNGKFYQLKERTELRWSPEIVEKGAFLNWSDSNLIIHYQKGAIYRKLYENKEWKFVLMLSGIAEEQSRMLNYTNFRNTGVYGWIKK